MIELNKIYQGDVLDELKKFPDNFVDLIVTSPPYWNLRNYGNIYSIFGGDSTCKHEWEKYIRASNTWGTPNKNIKSATVGATQVQAQWTHEQEQAFCRKCGAWYGQLGREPTPQQYIDNLMLVMNECKRILKPTGSFWINISDSYGGINLKNQYQKSLVGIPERLVIFMTDSGWLRRNTIIWYKPNAMPSPHKDRFTVDFEYFYFFSKSKKYFFEQQFEPYLTPMNRWGGEILKANGGSSWDEGAGQNTYRTRNMRPNPAGRTKRSVWKINTKRYKGAHFATFPEELIKIPILSCCPQFICNKCNKPRQKMYDKIKLGERDDTTRTHTTKDHRLGNSPVPEKGWQTLKYENGYTDCGCNVGFNSGIVLDPFCGSGTALKVAKEYKLNWIGIENNPEYVKLAVERINVF